ASPRRFAPLITTVPAEGPSAEWFDRSLPRHPPCRADLALIECDVPSCSGVCPRALLSGHGLRLRSADFISALATGVPELGERQTSHERRIRGDGREGRRRYDEDGCLLRRRRWARVRLNTQLVLHFTHSGSPPGDTLGLELVLGGRDLAGQAHGPIIGFDAHVDEVFDAICREF